MLEQEQSEYYCGLKVSTKDGVRIIHFKGRDIVADGLLYQDIIDNADLQTSDIRSRVPDDIDDRFCQYLNENKEYIKNCTVDDLLETKLAKIRSKFLGIEYQIKQNVNALTSLTTEIENILDEIQISK